MSSENDVDPWRSSQDAVAILLGQTAPDGNLHVRVGLLARGEVADVAVELVVGVLPDRAGVEHHHVGVGPLRCAQVAGFLQQAGETLGVVHVHLAAIRADLIGPGPRLQRGHTAHRTEVRFPRKN